MSCLGMAFAVVLFLTGLASYHGFNLDVEEPLVFQEDGASFGQSVVQFDKSRLVVGAPLEVVTVNKTGRLYDCTPATRGCQPISLNTTSEAVDMSLGLSLAASTHLSQLLACGPTVHKACGVNMYIKGTCLLLDSHLQIIRTVPAALPECPNQEIDIAFLIDGSGSIDRADFKRMKDFVRAVMDLSKGTDTQFSLMQYSNLMKTHFTFSQFQTTRSSRSLVDPIAQLNGLTFTATGIQKVVRELFHRRNGARTNARKIIIVITDGEKFKDPLKYSDVIPEAEKANIIRYAIGVGDAFQAHTARQELDIIGSKPSDEHVFMVDNFAALSSIQKQLQEKIFAVEGTQSTASSSFQHEMSQEGFSSILTMIGSYFGASLCSVDVNGDSSSDLVLIGAPHFYEQTQGGQVSVCPFPRRRAKWKCNAVLRGEPGHPWSRFGAALTTMGDVNGDRLADVAIGAPGEQENQGAVYLFHGTSELGISPSHSQDCVEDMVNPIILRLNFSLVGEPIASSQNLRPVLAVGSQDLFTASLPFEKNCGQDHLCEGDLSVNLSFSGLEILVVGSSLELNVIAMVSNEGEDSYGTVISFYYPAGLSYRRTLAIQGTFMVTFDVSYKATLGDKLHLRANVSSENNKPTSNKTTSQLELPVKYAVYTVISRQEESTKYFNFSTSDQKSTREAEHRYRVNNLSQRDLAISVHFWVPVLLNGVAVWDVVLVAPSQSLPCVSEREPPQQPDFQTQMPSSLVLNCSIADCLRFRCDIPSFGIQEELDFILKGKLSFGWASQLLQKKTLVVSMAEVTFNRSVYTQISGQEAFLRAQVEMVLEEYEVYNPMPLLVSSSMGGLLLLALITALLYKCGFFKRQYKEMMDNQPEDTAALNGEDIHSETPDPPLSE
ncbi:hypothetical protein G4228_007372 [Cervus hanglu yarkandensis]|nr:hypothetical protein G4228_007372 [Cervus hanglu yarkandensis]